MRTPILSLHKRSSSSRSSRSVETMKDLHFSYLDDPGVKIRFRKDASELGVNIDELTRERDDMNDSIVEKYEGIFEKVWYVGHMLVMTGSILSILLCLTRQVRKPWPRLIYRSTFVGAAFTYYLSLLQNLNGAQPGFYALLPLATFQYCMLALVWIFTTPHTVKLIPFALYSLLHVADTASEHHSQSKSRSKISKGLSDRLAPKVVDNLPYLDMWLAVELVFDCIFIRSGAVVALLVFLFFMRVKMMYSPITQDAFYRVYKYFDRYLTRKQTPKSIRELWIRLRNKIQTNELKTSELYKEDTEKAIEMVNLYNDLTKQK